MNDEKAIELDEWILEKELEDLADEIDDILSEHDGAPLHEVQTQIMIAIRKELDTNWEKDY